MQSYAPLRLALLACVAALTPTTVDRRSAMKLPLAVVALAPGAVRAADDVIVSGTVNAAEAAVGPDAALYVTCLLYTSPSPRDGLLSRMPSSA